MIKTTEQQSECNFSPFDENEVNIERNKTVSKEIAINQIEVSNEKLVLGKVVDNSCEGNNSKSSTDDDDDGIEEYMVDLDEENGDLNVVDDINKSESSSSSANIESVVDDAGEVNITNEEGKLIKLDEPGNSNKELFTAITPNMIETLKMKLNKYREYKRIVDESFDQINFDIKFDELPIITDRQQKIINKPIKINNKNDTIQLNQLNNKLNQELKEMKQQLENRTKQLQKATDLLAMMKKGLLERGNYIKMLIQDNKRLREEIKLAMIERKTLWEKFANDYDDLPKSDALEETADF